MGEKRSLTSYFAHIIVYIYEIEGEKHMKISAAKFRANCLKLINDVHATQEEIIITKHGKPMAKLICVKDESPKPFIGSLTGVGETAGDLNESFEDYWETG